MTDFDGGQLLYSKNSSSSLKIKDLFEYLYYVEHSFLDLGISALYGNLFFFLAAHSAFTICCSPTSPRNLPAQCSLQAISKSTRQISIS
jgi:hypothetical protein